MASKKQPRQYGYFSHFHEDEPGCLVRIYRTPYGNERKVTGFGSTRDPEESGYLFLQAQLVGEITPEWELIDQYSIPSYPKASEYLEDPEKMTI
jgi:hypothetical protein